MPRCSLITIAYQRQQHLDNLLQGLCAGSCYPDEVIVVNMDDSIKPMQNLPFAIRYITLPKKQEALPLAEARNLGAVNARYNDLIFLDVDCIPSATFVARMCRYLELYPGLIIGEPRYLLAPLTDLYSEDDLEALSIRHPHRPRLQEAIRFTDAYELFWSLCFGISKTYFNKVKGFDETYKGYGAEDTDFAYKLRKGKVPFFLSNAKVYHQQHPVYSPPLNHFEAIIRNSNTFYKKWKVWPMQTWLQEFKNLGLIQWSADDRTRIQVRQKPRIALIESKRLDSAPFI